MGGALLYQALYRKWRPKTFSDVVGHEHITATLRRQVAEGRLSHAYLFTGTRGTGKTTCAKILAKAVNCENPQNGDPCNACPACLGIDSGAFLDVTELDAASNNGVDSVRALRDEAVYSPAQVKKRVYIIDEVHMLSGAAFNALLKILEEPPEHLMFILATTELHKVLPTILSRCQRFAFRRILPRDIEARLDYVAKQEGIDLRPDGAELLARLSDGALRDALSLLDQCSAAGGVIDARAVLDTLGLAGNVQTAQLMALILQRDAKAALLLLHQLLNKKLQLICLELQLQHLPRKKSLLIYLELLFQHLLKKKLPLTYLAKLLNLQLRLPTTWLPTIPSATIPLAHLLLLLLLHPSLPLLLSSVTFQNPSHPASSSRLSPRTSLVHLLRPARILHH